MVDRIVPATTPADLDRVETLTDRRDEAPVMHEPFRQWVVEDRFCNGRPDLARSACRWSRRDAVRAHEAADAERHPFQPGLSGLSGRSPDHRRHDADPVMAQFVDRLWRSEIIPALTPPPAPTLRPMPTRWRRANANPAIRHRPPADRHDGSQKQPQRILGTIAEAAPRAGARTGLTLAVAAWMRYASGRDEAVGRSRSRTRWPRRWPRCGATIRRRRSTGSWPCRRSFPPSARRCGFRADLTDA